MGKFFGKLEGQYVECGIHLFLDMTYEQKVEHVKKYCPWCCYMKNKSCMCFPLLIDQLKEIMLKEDLPKELLEITSEGAYSGAHDEHEYWGEDISKTS